MNLFEQDKADKLNRLPGLRIMDALGMVAWRKDEYGFAYQKLRMLHPLSWIWAAAMILLALVMHGAIRVVKELKTLWQDDCAWW